MTYICHVYNREFRHKSSLFSSNLQLICQLFTFLMILKTQNTLHIINNE